MKKRWQMAVASLVLLFTSPLFAIAPAAIHASYDSARQELSVTVQHPVTDRFDHYISEVVVSKNGAEVAREHFDFQTSRRNQTMPPFQIEAQAGDAFEIVARCNSAVAGETSLPVK